MGAVYLFELQETCKVCKSAHYEFWHGAGEFFVYCPTCDKSWVPCKSARNQYRDKLGEPAPQRLKVTIEEDD